MLLLRGANSVAPGSVPLARAAARLTDAAREWIDGDALPRMVDEHRARIGQSLPERLDWVARGCDHRAAELIARRQQVGRKARAGDARAAEDLAKVKEAQRQLGRRQGPPAAAAPGRAVPRRRRSGSSSLAHALVLPTADADERRRHDAQVEEIAMRIAQAARGGRRGRRHTTSPGPTSPAAPASAIGPASTCCRSVRPAPDAPSRSRGRARTGDIELSENEWAKACNLRGGYWLYAVYDCATPRPRLVRVRDPFGKLLVRSRELSAYSIPAAAVHAAAQEAPGSEQ